MDILDEIDISNDPEVERLGANATVQYAQQYWNRLYKAAQQDSFAYDPLWNDDNDLDTTGENHPHHNHDGSAGSTNNKTYYYTQQIVLTESKEQDYRLYRRFRSNLSKTFWNVERIVMPDMNRFSTNSTSMLPTIHNNNNSNPLCNEKWQSLLLACEGVIPDFNFITLLRPYVFDFPYHNDLLTTTSDELGEDTTSLLSEYIIVPRIQFIYIEVARCYEGYYSTRKFRQVLQLYTIKGIDEKLHHSFRTKLLSALSHGINGNKRDGPNESSLKTDLVSTQKAIMNILHCLATEWPYPSLYTLRTTGIVFTLQYVLRQINLVVARGSDPQFQQFILKPIQYACQQQLQNWHDLLQLRRITKSLPISMATNTKGSSINNKGVQNNYCDSLQRLLQKSFHASIVDVDVTEESNRALARMVGSNRHKSSRTGKAEVLRQNGHASIEDRYVSRTTSNLSDVIASPSLLTASYNELDYQSGSYHRNCMASIFRDYGIVILSNFCTEQQIQQCSEQAYIALERLQQEQLLPRNIQIRGQNTFDFVEVRQRPGHRVDNRYMILDDPHSPIATLGKMILKEVIEQQLFPNKNVSDITTDISKVDKVSSSSWKLLYAGVVHAFPRENDSIEYPPSQFWHRDGPSLFEDHDDHHHATHCFNVFVPLVDVQEQNGTTEFVPGTHEDKRYNKVVADILLNHPEKYAGDAGIVRADLKAGSLIFFDVRVLHRGLSNQSATERPMLYYTFGRDWFQEQHMFQKIESLLASGHKSNDEALESSVFNLCRELLITVAGQQLSQVYFQLKDTGTCNEKLEYGHPHYTLRFDLLLAEQWMMSMTGAAVTDTSAMRNYFAVLKFHNLSDSQKKFICEEFVRILSSTEAWEMKRHLLQQTRQKREEQRLMSTETILDFASMQEDMSDVAALYKLTIQLLLTQLSHYNSKQSLLPQMGFSEDESGLYVAVALLKVYTVTITKTIDKSCNDNSTHAEIEECFTSWWNALPNPSRFHLIVSKCTPTNGGDSLRSVIVVFSSLGSGLCRLEWMGTLKAIGVYEQIHQVDVLHVVDFACSWYCQDPTCTWNGYEYYMKELKEQLKPYSKVFFLGDSMGGSAALRFSPLAQSVLVFTPQIDILNYEAVTRTDFTKQRREQFHGEIVEAMRDENNKAIITIHYGLQCIEDVRQLQPLILQHKPNVQFVGHDFDDHVLSLHLRNLGELTGLVNEAIVKQFLSL